jgi:hypothetical protein
MKFDFDDAYQRHFLTEHFKMQDSMESIFKRSDEFDERWMYNKLLAEFTNLSLEVTKAVLKEYQDVLQEKFDQLEAKIQG